MHPEGVPPAGTKPPTAPAPEVEPLDERVPPGRYINPVRGMVIGLIVMGALGLCLGVLMILQPDVPPPSMGYLLSVQHPRAGAPLPGGEPAFLVEFTLGSSDGAPLADTDIAGLTVHVRSSSAPGAARFASTPCRFHVATGTFRCRVAAPTTTAAGGAQTYLTVVEYPNSSGRRDVTVAPTVDASMSNPFVVRFT
jgi:hypothetical protein